MPTYEALQNRKNELIRKALSGSLFVGPYSAPAIESLTGPDGDLIELPDPYTDGGWMTDDGMQFSRDVDTSDVTSFGSIEPTRSDINSDTLTVQVQWQETNKLTISMLSGADISSLVPDPDTGELQIKKPARPSARYYRILALAVDENDDGEIYIGRFLPRCKISEWGDQAWAKGDDAIQTEVTLQAFQDSNLGFSQMDLFGGPGWKAQLEAMGFAAASGGGGE